MINGKKITAIIELTRPLNSVMAAFAALLGFWLSEGSIRFPFEAFLAAAATFTVSGAGQAINDYYDREIDAKKKKSRPLPSGRVSPAEARTFAISLFLLGIALGYSVNAHAFIIAVAMSALLYAYSARLGKFKYIGNILVALATSFTYVMGASITDNYMFVLIIAACSFFSTWAREITKDLEDYEEDKGSKTTLPMIWGKVSAVREAMLSTAISIFLGVLPIFLQIHREIQFLLLMGGSAGIFAMAAIQLNRGLYKEAQGTYKLGMLAALLAFTSTLL